MYTINPSIFLYYSAWLALAMMLLTSQTAFSQDALLESHITKVMAEAKIPSFATASIKGGRIVQMSTFGEQSPGITATNSSTYHIASLTKPDNGHKTVLPVPEKLGTNPRVLAYLQAQVH